MKKKNETISTKSGRDMIDNLPSIFFWGEGVWWFVFVCPGSYGVWVNFGN